MKNFPLEVNFGLMGWHEHDEDSPCLVTLDLQSRRREDGQSDTLDIEVKGPDGKTREVILEIVERKLVVHCYGADDENPFTVRIGPDGITTDKTDPAAPPVKGTKPDYFAKFWDDFGEGPPNDRWMKRWWSPKTDELTLKAFYTQIEMAKREDNGIGYARAELWQGDVLVERYERDK